MAQSMSVYKQNGVEYTIDDPTVAPVFAAATAYAAGQYVKHEGKLYKLTAAHAANDTWANTSKVQVILGQEVSDLKSTIGETNNYFGFSNYSFTNRTNTRSDISYTDSKVSYSANANDEIEILIKGTALTGTDVYLYFFYGDSSTPTGIDAQNVGEYKKYKLTQGINAISFYNSSAKTTIGNYQIIIRTIETNNILARINGINSGLLENEYETQAVKDSVYETNEVLGFKNYTCVKKHNTASNIDVSDAYTPFSASNGDKIQILITGNAINKTVVALYFYYGESTTGTYIGGITIGEYKEYTLSNSINGISFYSNTAVAGDYQVSCRIINDSIFNLKSLAENNRTDIILQSWLTQNIQKSNSFIGTYKNTRSSIGAGDIKPIYSANKGEKVRINIDGSAITANEFTIYFYYNDSTAPTNAGKVFKGTDRIIELPNAINALTLYTTNTIAGDVVIKIETLKNDFPDYYCGYIYDKAARINALASACAANGDVFIFITDQHWQQNQKHSTELIKYLNGKCRINRLFNGGDASDSVSSYALEYMKEIQNNYPRSIHSLMGNHELMGAYGNEWYYYADIYNNDQIGNAEKHYYYVDNVQLKIRYIVLASYMNTTGTIGTGYTQEQLTWLTQTALNVSSEWSIIVFAHDFYETAEGIDDYKDALDTAKTNGKDIICVFSGHMHYDAVWHTVGGIPIIATTCDKNGAWIDQGVNKEPWLTEYRITGTTTEQAFDVVVIDKEQKKITCVRIGGLAMNNVDKIPTDSGWTYVGTLEEREISYDD